MSATAYSANCRKSAWLIAVSVQVELMGSQ